MVKFYEGLYEALTRYVRALAWWHAVPKPRPSKLKSAPKQLPETRSRLALRIEAGGEPDLPSIDPETAFLIGYLFDAGPTSAAGMGSIPLTWADLDAWQRGSGVSLPPWQLRLIRKLSGDYLAESMIADAHDAPPPWNREADRGKIAAHIRNVLRG